MTIKIKYNIGNEIFCLHNNKIFRCQINTIELTAYPSGRIHIRYEVVALQGCGDIVMHCTVEDSEIFHSAEDLTATLLNNINASE